MRDLKRMACGILSSAALLCAASRLARAQDASDSTLLLTERLLQRAVTAAKDAPLGDNSDAGDVLMALRSTRDIGLLPLFQKLRASKSPENQAFAMVASAILAKDAGVTADRNDPNVLDIKALMAIKDTALQTAALGTLINAKAISAAELKQVLDTAPEAIQKTMAASELNLQKKLEDRSVLKDLLKNDKPIVRFDTAATILDSQNAAEVADAVAEMKKMSAEHDPHQAPVEALMLDRLEKEKLTAGLPWAIQIAGDEAADEGLRYTAVATVLAFEAPEGPQILADMIQKQKDAIQQVKLGLIAIQYAAQLKKESLAPLAASKSTLARTIGNIALKAADKNDTTQDLLDLIKLGHPIVLDWAFQYSDHLDTAFRVTLRTALVNQATIVDNVRDRDYERAALSVNKMLEEDGDAGRKVVATLLVSDNRAVVDATLSGMYRSGVKDESEAVLKVWTGLTKSTSTENAANYAALILAREGHKEALAWLPGMVVGGTVQGAGFRALSGWYYAKLTGQTDALLKVALAD